MNFSASVCVFNGFFMRLGPYFSHVFFARKDISWRVRKPNAKQNRFQIVTIFFLLFSSAYFLDQCSRRFWQSTFSTDPWLSWADPEGGTGGPDPPPLKNHKNLGFLSNTGSDLLKNHKATKPAFNVGPFKLNGVSLAGR